MTVNEDQIRRLLERYGQAMSVGDLAGILSCWELPALVLYDESAILIANSGELERLFTRIIGSYRSRGLLTTRPQIERTEGLTDRLAAVDVRWPDLGAEGVVSARRG